MKKRLKAQQPPPLLSEKSTQWEWYERYRVWDANRKIFVYPENWIEPDVALPRSLRIPLREVMAAVQAQCPIGTQRSHKLKLRRAKGVCLLLTGKDQTAMLVTAQTLASDLEMDLYRVALGEVVSKYIGETEKNLGKVFDTVKTGGAVLLLDEAEVLFVSRSEVKDSHDRYANIELNYLLQRIENFGGLSILSTDKCDDLDSRLLRRFRFIIRVPKSIAFVIPT
jgi:ATP-dependent 26S proteasome regulatory subunit